MSLKGLKYYFERDKLGSLHYPQEGLTIKLENLYKMITDWSPDRGVTRDFDGIFGVLTFGDAITGFEYEAKGEIIKGKPHKANFLVLMHGGVSRYHDWDEEFRAQSPIPGTGFQVPELENGGICIHYRNVDDLQHGADGFVVQAISQGAIVLYDERLLRFIEEHKISTPTKQVVWENGPNNNLEGRLI